MLKLYWPDSYGREGTTISRAEEHHARLYALDHSALQRQPIPAKVLNGSGLGKASPERLLLGCIGLRQRGDRRVRLYFWTRTLPTDLFVHDFGINSSTAFANPISLAIPTSATAR